MRLKDLALGVQMLDCDIHLGPVVRRVISAQPRVSFSCVQKHFLG